MGATLEEKRISDFHKYTHYRYHMFIERVVAHFLWSFTNVLMLFGPMYDNCWHIFCLCKPNLFKHDYTRHN